MKFNAFITPEGKILKFGLKPHDRVAVETFNSTVPKLLQAGFTRLMWRTSGGFRALDAYDLNKSLAAIQAALLPLYESEGSVLVLVSEKKNARPATSKHVESNWITDLATLTLGTFKDITTKVPFGERDNPGDLEFLPYIDVGMKALLLKSLANKGVVAWHSGVRGDPHHEDVAMDYFPDDQILSQILFDRKGVIYVTAERAKSEDEAIDLVGKILPAFVWDNIYDDNDLIIEWGYHPNTKTYEAAIDIRIRDLPKIGLKRHSSNPRRRR